MSDAARAAVLHRGLVAEASRHLTETVAIHLPYESLGPFKTSLKRFFSDADWGIAEANELADLVSPHLPEGYWRVDLDDDLALEHGIVAGTYVIKATGAATAPPTIFDRIFAGPVTPEPTPHPLKVKFTFGGEPAPGVWFRRGDDTTDDPRVRRLFIELDVTDVMVAGDFVTIGLGRPSRWEDRLDDLLDLVTALFEPAETSRTVLTRDELITEGQSVRIDSDRLHLLDPDQPDQQRRLLDALDADDATVRRVAVAILAGATDLDLARMATRTGYGDPSLQVRRMAIDAAGDAEDEGQRPLLESALADRDPWIRWRAVRALADLGAELPERRLHDLRDDPDFQVRFEVERVLREP